MVAAIIEVGGAVLFLVAGYTEQNGSIRSIGHVAGMIGIMTSCCCFFLLPFSPDNYVNLNWRQLQCMCKSTYCSVSVCVVHSKIVLNDLTVIAYDLYK